MRLECFCSWPHTLYYLAREDEAKAAFKNEDQQLDALDADHNGRTDVADAVYLLIILKHSHGWRKGRSFTLSPLGTSVLPGITRATAIQLAADCGLELVEQSIPREWLYIADELFFTGTAAEITPIRSVDRIKIGSGKRGPVTKQLQQEFTAILTCATEDRHGWLNFVGTPKHITV